MRSIISTESDFLIALAPKANFIGLKIVSMPIIRKNNLLYPELSYKIVGLLFEIYESFGPGRREEYYQKALSIALSDAKLAFKKELPVKINYKGKFIATNYLDFLVEEKRKGIWH